MTSTTSTVYVVDDDASFRASVARLLQVSGYSVELFESGSAFLQRLPAGEAAGCLLLDVQMSSPNGFELQERLTNSGSILPIVFLTAHGDIPASVKAMKGGAEDFLSKPASKTALLEAVERALSRYSVRRQQLDRLKTMRDLVARLTPRESEVFALIVRGKLNKQVAGELGTSERTVKAHRRAIMEKLEVMSFAQAVSIAERLGMLIEPGSADGDE